MRFCLVGSKHKGKYTKANKGEKLWHLWQKFEQN